jgi:integrase
MSFSVNGVQHRLSTGTDDKKLAQRIFDKVMGQVAEEKWFPKKPQERVYTYDDLAAEYEEFAKPRHRGFEKTTKSALVKLQAHFGGMTLPLKRKAIVEFQTVMLAKKRVNGEGLKPAYINRLTSVLRSMYTYGIDVGILQRDSVLIFERTKLKGEVKRMRFLSLEEADRLIHACDAEVQPIVITALNTRLSLFALK